MFLRFGAWNRAEYASCIVGTAVVHGDVMGFDYMLCFVTLCLPSRACCTIRLLCHSLLCLRTCTHDRCLQYKHRSTPHLPICGLSFFLAGSWAVRPWLCLLMIELLYKPVGWRAIGPGFGSIILVVILDVRYCLGMVTGIPC